VSDRLAIAGSGAIASRRAWIASQRGWTGVNGTYEPRTIRDVLRELKSNRAVGLVLDQYAGPPIGVRVPLFGVPVGTANTVAVMAKRTGAPVLMVVNFRNSDGSYTVDIRPPLELSLGSEGAGEAGPEQLARATAKCVAVIERDIYAHPEQWLWVHRRWR